MRTIFFAFYNKFFLGTLSVLAFLTFSSDQAQAQQQNLPLDTSYANRGVGEFPASMFPGGGYEAKSIATGKNGEVILLYHSHNENSLALAVVDQNGRLKGTEVVPASMIRGHEHDTYLSHCPDVDFRSNPNFAVTSDDQGNIYLASALNDYHEDEWAWVMMKFNARLEMDSTFGENGIYLNEGPFPAIRMFDLRFSNGYLYLLKDNALCRSVEVPVGWEIKRLNQNGQAPASFEGNWITINNRRQLSESQQLASLKLPVQLGIVQDKIFVLLKSLTTKDYFLDGFNLTSHASLKNPGSPWLASTWNANAHNASSMLVMGDQILVAGLTDDHCSFTHSYTLSGALNRNFNMPSLCQGQVYPPHKVLLAPRAADRFFQYHESGGESPLYSIKASGEIDTYFGNNGKVTALIPDNMRKAYLHALDSNTMIAGYTDSSPSVVKLSKFKIPDRSKDDVDLRLSSTWKQIGVYLPGRVAFVEVNVSNPTDIMINQMRLVSSISDPYTAMNLDFINARGVLSKCRQQMSVFVCDKIQLPPKSSGRLTAMLTFGPSFKEIDLNVHGYVDVPFDTNTANNNIKLTFNVTPSGPTCSPSGTPNNTSSKGFVEGFKYDRARVLRAYKNEDMCIGMKVLEQTCQGNSPSSTLFQCPTGCTDGACEKGVLKIPLQKRRGF